MLVVVTYLRELLDACNSEVRAHLDSNERVLAIGRCEDVTEWGGPERGGAGWTYVMVTNARLRWVPRVDLRFETSLDLNRVSAVTEEMISHRYAITLKHPPVRALRIVPAHRFLTFKWGNAVKNLHISRTKLAFSRRETAAARALREQLASRGLL